MALSAPHSPANQEALLYKPSGYNFFFHFPEDDKYLIYNSISNGLAQVEGHIYRQLKEAGDDWGELLTDPQNRRLVQELVSGNILVDKDLDEKEFLKLKLNLQRFNSRTLMLTVVPTLRCNLGCVYCYQGRHSHTDMGRETERAVLDFTHKKLKDQAYKKLHITWYGGEPLLNTDTVYRLSEGFSKMCKNRRVSYAATMVTNGTLLNDEIITRLKSYKVKALQVTLDGTEKVHDARRPFTRDGRGSFGIVMDNISRVMGKISLNIRINVDKTNYDGTIELLEKFKNLGWLNRSKDVFLYIGYTREWTPECNHIAKDCFSMREFTEAEMDFQEQLAARGYDIGNLYPSHSAYCMAASNHGFVVEPGGELHKCWSHIGNPEAYLGNVEKPVVIGKKLLKWLAYEPLDLFEDCKACKFFPVCAGGCPYVPLFQADKIRRDPLYNCTPWKIFMEKKIKKFLAQKISTRETGSAQEKQT